MLMKKYNITDKDQFELIASRMKIVFADILDDGKLTLERYFSKDTIDFLSKLKPNTIAALLKMINVFKSGNDSDE